MATATELRSQIALLSEEAAAALAAFWAQLRGSAEGSQLVVSGSGFLFDTVISLVSDYGDAASFAAARWYDDYRADLNVSGTYSADIVDLDLGAEALAGWGESLATAEDADLDAALERINGGLERRIAVAGRETITQNVYDDPQGIGWQRQARPTACGFCQMLAGRAELYKTRDTASFGAHDNCQCVAMPAFGGLPVPVKAYTPTSRNITDADRARTRAWIKANL